MSCLSLDPQSLTHKGGARFTRTGIAADAVGAAQTRVELGELLDQQFALGDERLNDLRLATCEALANAAEFAYLDFPTPGTMDLRAHLRFRFVLFAVTIKDRGKWRQPVDDSIGADDALACGGAGFPSCMPSPTKQTITPAQPERRSGDGGTLCCHSTADRLQLARRQPLGRRLKSLAPSWGPYRHSGVGCPPLVTQTANRVTCYGFVLARVVARKRQQRASFEISLRPASAAIPLGLGFHVRVRRR